MQISRWAQSVLRVFPEAGWGPAGIWAARVWARLCEGVSLNRGAVMQDRLSSSVSEEQTTQIEVQWENISDHTVSCWTPRETQAKKSWLRVLMAEKHLPTSLSLTYSVHLAKVRKQQRLLSVCNLLLFTSLMWKWIRNVSCSSVIQEQFMVCTLEGKSRQSKVFYMGQTSDQNWPTNWLVVWDKLFHHTTILVGLYH